MKIPAPAAKSIADAVVALKQARTLAEAMDLGEAKVMRIVQLDRSTADLARAVQRATAKRR